MQPCISAILGFERIGNNRGYSAFNGNPAIPLCLDLNDVIANRPPRWKKFFGEKIPSQFLRSHPISAAEREYFLNLLDRQGVSLEESEFEICNEDEVPSYSGYGSDTESSIEYNAAEPVTSA